MVLYFSGTGNSRYVAEKLASLIEDECVNLFDKIKGQDFSDIDSTKPWVIVTPIYAYKIPPVVEQWLLKAKLHGCKAIYFVNTCGAGICGAGYYNRDLSQKIDKQYKGTAAIIMPENYIAMFKAPGEQEARKIINKALPAIENVATAVKAELSLPAKYDSKIKGMGSLIVNEIFFKVNRDKRFMVTDACVGCGECSKKCVKNNIEIVSGKPKWNGDCTHCMACICGCPKSAIEYGKATRGKVRYQAPDIIN